MKLIASLLFLFAASPALAIMAPGPPPWSCDVLAACKDENTCIFLNPRLPIQFGAKKIAGNWYHLQGYDGYEQDAVEFLTFTDATKFAETYDSGQPVPLLLIRNQIVSDTNSFWLQTVTQLARGRRSIQKEKTLVTCNSVRRQ